jgi:hypothetical protein
MKALSIVIARSGGGGTIPPTITTTSLLDGTAWVPYHKALTATGALPITWSLSDGRLPAGLSLNGITGEISGTPTKAGVFAFTVRATNSAGNATRDLIIVIASGGSGGSGKSGDDEGGGGCNAANVAGAVAMLLLGISFMKRWRRCS